MVQERAKLFDGAAERYDRCRPGYPAPLIDEILGPSPAALSVLDVACGTGIAARAIAARGARVLGVELNPGMAAVAESHGITVEVSPFETWDARDRSFDRVICAQAWHWLDHEVSVVKATALLRRGGRLCLFWSCGHHPDELSDALREVYLRILPADAPPLVTGYGTNRRGDPAADFAFVAEALAGVDGLGEPRVDTYPWTARYTTQRWVDELLTHSDHLALETGLRDRLLDAVADTIDALGGAFDMPYETVLISAWRD